MRVTVTLPIPSRTLSPNGRHHWRTKAAAKKKAREDGRLATLAALSPVASARPLWLNAVVSVRLVRKDGRGRWDDDNLIAACKAYVDGVVDAGLMANDKGLRWGSVEQVVDKTDRAGRIELTFTSLVEQKGT